MKLNKSEGNEREATTTQNSLQTKAAMDADLYKKGKKNKKRGEGGDGASKGKKRKAPEGDRREGSKEKPEPSAAGVVDTFLRHMEDRDLRDAAQPKGHGKLRGVKLTCIKGEGPTEQVRVFSDKEDVGFLSNEAKDERCVFTGLERYSIKERLIRHWGTLHGNSDSSFVDPEQAALFAALHQYKDVLHLRREAPNPKAYDGVLDAVLLHCINHVMKTSDAVKKGNESARDRDGEREPQRDQGFTRPKILVLLPLRKFAYNFIHRLMKIVMLPNFSRKHFKSISGGQQFLDEYSTEDQEDLPESVRKGLNKPMQNKPVDFRNIFEGNSDDHFRMGIKLTKSSVKLFSDFYKSDIVLASPLGLVTLINDAERGSDKSFEFLSSIETLVVDFADVLMMQNWEHVLTIVSHVNEIPASNHDTDIMRIREWYLAGNAKRYRQNVVLSSYAAAELNSFMGAASNFEGLVKIPPRIEAKGVMNQIVNPVKQLYIKHTKAGGIEEESESKLAHFGEEVLAKVLESFSPGVMIFVRSYFDFVRLRNKLDEENADFVALSEYTDRSEADRYRSFFANGTKRILLYSERAHFYFRYRFKGIRDVVFYSLPDHGHFYSELLNMIDASSIQQPTATVVFSKYDSLQLSRVVGLSQAKQMLSSETDTFMMV